MATQTQQRGREETGVSKGVTTKGYEGGMQGGKFERKGEGKVQCQSIMPNIGLDKKACEISGRVLNTVLADQFVIGNKTSNYSFNVVGPRSHELHELFKRQAIELVNLGVLTAKNIRVNGHKVPNVIEKLNFARLDLPKEGDWPAAEEMVRILLNDHEKFLQHACQDLDQLKQTRDKATKDFMLDVIKQHRIMAYHLRDLLERNA
jgi:starvation-inducible DNA-binding protein